MPTINLTNNTDVILTASSADDNATLNRYLESVLTLKTPPSFAPISDLLVKDQREPDFPLTFSAMGEAKFAVEKTTLDIQTGPTASIGLLQGSDESDFYSALKLTGDASSSGLVSFALGGALTAANTATESDFTFGITNGGTFTLTSYYAAAAGDKLLDAVNRAANTLTIPHDIADLKSLPPGAICRLDASGSLKFSASFTYSFLNDPLATVSLGSLPAFDISATASATIEGTVTHTSDHTVTIVRRPNGHAQVSVSLTKTDDFERSLTVSAGATAKIGTQDSLAFLLDKINPNSAAEADTIASQMPNAAQFKADIKSTIDTAISSAIAASLKAALDTSKANNRMFVYDIDPAGLDDISTIAVQSALTGDFTALTATGAKLTGVTQVDSALTVTATHTHTLALHFLGIFNAASINEFVEKSKINFTNDTHEVVLSNETLGTAINNLNAEKLRRLLLKDITLTLPASANTKDVSTPITLAFIDREGSTSASKMRQFVNVLNYLGAPTASAAQALLARNLKSFGVCSLSLGLSLDPMQCGKLFAGPGGAYDRETYVAALCKAQLVILAGDPDSAYRLPLFRADQDTWNRLQEAGAPGNVTPILRGLGMSDTEAQTAVTDVITTIWWADAMAAYAKALANGQSLIAAGKEVVKESNDGYNEPWMVLSAWDLAGRPAIQAQFVTSLPAPAIAVEVR